MYIVTFYSFKGGVGRTMALVNVGVHLAQTGRKVLLVDFDLEAPGITTFAFPKPRDQRKGVVDYLTDYLETGAPPALGEYVYESGARALDSGALWIMPAGDQDADYGRRLNSLDWQDLYRHRAGYLLFENLKNQWEAEIQPDYVLIDSRTGYTDVGGICTRQLPDAVVALFSPNEQNLRGLPRIVRDIRSESKPPRNKSIHLHFVNANVPDLDDEDQILAKLLESFKESLGYKRLTATIRHYSNLALLNQVIFTMERPRSRLAQEYNRLAEAITKENLEDRIGALDFLSEVQPWRRSAFAEDLEDKLTRVRKLHREDPDVLVQLAQIRQFQGRGSEALSALNEAGHSRELESDVLVQRAQLLAEHGDESAAVEDVRKLLDRTTGGRFELSPVIALLKKLAPEDLLKLPSSPALKAVEPEEIDRAVEEELQSDRNWLLVAERLLRTSLDRPGTKTPRKSSILSNLVLVLIGSQKYGAALDICSLYLQETGEPDAPYLFNSAMAQWGESGQVPVSNFKKLLDYHSQKSARLSGANNLQCLAIAAWATKDFEHAQQLIGASRQAMEREQIPAFSPWRYLKVMPGDFYEDLQAILRLINGADESPPVFDIHSSDDVGTDTAAAQNSWSPTLKPFVN